MCSKITGRPVRPLKQISSGTKQRKPKKTIRRKTRRDATCPTPRHPPARRTPPQRPRSPHRRRRRPPPAPPRSPPARAPPPFWRALSQELEQDTPRRVSLAPAHGRSAQRRGSEPSSETRACVASRRCSARESRTITQDSRTATYPARPSRSTRLRRPPARLPRPPPSLRPPRHP